MSFSLTTTAQNEADKTNIEPNLVLEIEGVDTIFGPVSIKKLIQYGDPDLEFGDPGIVYGGFNAVDNQKPYVSFTSGTSTSIKQSLNPDKGISQSISNMQVALVDKDQFVSDLISPDETVSPAFDLLGRKCKVWIGFTESAWKRDYIVIFRGTITDIQSGAGNILFNLANPEIKRKSSLFQRGTTELTAGITAGSTSIPVTDTTKFLEPVLGPDGLIDSALKFYVQVNDEIIRYETKTGTSFDTLTRGALGTTAASHSSGDDANSWFTLEDNGITLALKLMFSGSEGAFIESLDIKHIGKISPTESVSNSIFFSEINIFQETGVVIGDYITVTGATAGANNFAGRQVTDIVQTDDGSYIVVDGAALVDELDSPAEMAIRSQYDVWPEGAGMKMGGDEVDVAAHLSVFRTFLSSYEMLFYLKDTIEDGKKFTESQLYNPGGAFGIPRKSQASIGIHSPPLPATEIVKFDQTNVKNASKLRMRRTIDKNFQNVVSYAFDEDVLTDKFQRVSSITDADSLARIPVGPKLLNIEAKGLRLSLGAETIVSGATTRRLNKYKFAAEQISGIRTNFSTGFRLEIGDVVELDMASLKLTDIKNGSRDGDNRIFFIQNKVLNFKTGEVSFDITDNNFSLDSRFALIGPCSEVAAGVSSTVFTIKETGNSAFGVNEFKKWDILGDAYVKVHSADFTVSGTAKIEKISGNTITVDTPLGFTPLSGYFMELGDYDFQNDSVKLRYGFMTDLATFADGKIAYQMI